MRRPLMFLQAVNMYFYCLQERDTKLGILDKHLHEHRF